MAYMWLASSYLERTLNVSWTYLARTYPVATPFLPRIFS